MIGAIVGDIVRFKYDWTYFKSKGFDFLDPDKYLFRDDNIMTITNAV